MRKAIDAHVHILPETMLGKKINSRSATIIVTMNGVTSLISSPMLTSAISVR